jgi:RimJ/RimL family protein N-acetyltransferase
MHDKLALLHTLPYSRDCMSLRPWTRPDLDLLAHWPSYSFPFDAFNLSCAHQSPAALDLYFASRDNDPRRISLILDLPSQPAVGYLALLDLDYTTRHAGNLVVRLHPAHCSQGLGTSMMTLLTRWATLARLNSLFLDVAAANQRAVRCYAKAGFSIISEFWRDEHRLSHADLARPEYAFVLPHVRPRHTPAGFQIRFYGMQFDNTDRPMPPK